MADRLDGWSVLPGGKPLPSHSLTLADFPLGDLAGQSITVYRTGTGRLHFDRNCQALSRSRKLAEETIRIPEEGSLASLAIPDAHCGPGGELGQYLIAARTACAAAERLPSIAEQIGLRLPGSAAVGPWRRGTDHAIDLQAIGKAREVRDVLAQGGVAASRFRPPSLDDAHVSVLKATVKDSLSVANWLYEQGLSQARSSDGRRAMNRLLAALWVLTSSQRGRYEPIYRRYWDIMDEALHSPAALEEEYPARVADFLEDRAGFNLPQEWLEAVAETGEPHRAAATVREAMAHGEALKDPSLGKLLDSMLRVAAVCGTAYLDGLRARGEDAMLVIVEDYVSPINHFGPVHDLQWDVFDSAACSLRPDHPGDDVLDVRVAAVPRLWIEALKESPPSQRGYLVLAEALEGYPHSSETCVAVATAIARRCPAGLFRLDNSGSERDWRKARDTQLKYERLAREVAASVLSSLRPW